MKKLVALFTSLSSVSLVSLSALACKVSQKNLDENEYLFDMDKSFFEGNLSIEGIDGSILDFLRYYNDKLKL